MNQTTLASGHARATLIPARGGLLTSLMLDLPGRGPREILYLPQEFSASESGWPGGGLPVMFPFAGRTFYQGAPFQYELNGKAWQMPLHGFAWGQEFRILEQGAASITLETSDSEATRSLYPFRFALQMDYNLRPEQLLMRMTIRNSAASGDAMPVSAGLHPYFAVPFSAESSHDRCELHAPASEEIQVMASGAAGKSAPAATGPRQLRDPLSASLILGGLAGHEFSVRDLGAGEKISLSWSPQENIRHLVLWRKGNEHFHCVEPWMGLPDAVSTGAGLRLIPPGQSMVTEFAIRRQPASA